MATDGAVDDLDSEGVRIIAPAGEVDVSVARGLTRELSEAVGDPTRELIIDLSGVTFLDSTGLGAVIKARAQLNRQGRPMAVIAPPGPVADLLDVTGLRGELRVVGDRHQARAAVGR